ncbi:phage protein [Xenorhabdus vietnamensis]|uniref:Phage protein n=1 Tax=Xenorhabdus vietnamensis TaxID=351656 RepID=A0A1Y2S805_9GAMM|nr:PH domain-containing protein [Xenorhabdus vietnamensis]OTA14736.1 phage protein [Xenorhabdus vietnamensis]
MVINYKTASDADLLAELKKLTSGVSTCVSRGKKGFFYIIRELDIGEHPISALFGDRDGLKGTFILLTNANIHFVRISLLKKIHHDKFPRKSINSFEEKKGLLSAKLTLVIDGQHYVFDNIEKKLITPFLSQLNKPLTPSSPVPQSTASQSKVDDTNLDTSSLIDKLERIEELKEFDVINNKEFNTLKEYVLASNLDKSLATVDVLKLVDDLDKLNDFVYSGVITKKDFTTQKQALLQTLPTTK